MTLKYVTMPKWGIEMQRGTLSEWHVAEGDEITKGQLLALVETDKINNELEADMDGVVHKLTVSEGEEHVVGQLLAVIGDADETANAVDDFLAKFVAADTSVAAGGVSASDQSAENTDSTPSSASAPKAPAIDDSAFEGLSISPAAKALAIKLSIDPTSVTATGRRGRMSLQDVEQAAIAAGLMNSGGDDADAGAGDNTPTIVAMSSLQKTAAKRLTEAKSTIPHFYLRSVVALDALLAAKAELKNSGVKVSLNDMFIKAVASALNETPDVNVQLFGDNIHKFPHADIAVAVATESGLVTPVVKMADLKDLSQISTEVGTLAEKARNKKLTREDLAPGTFTISNLGMFGIDEFDAIINPPQCAILAIGAGRRAFIEDGKDGKFVTQVTLTLSCDHRAIDGALGAIFLQNLQKIIEAGKV